MERVTPHAALFLGSVLLLLAASGPTNASRAGCGGAFEPACEKYATANVLGKAPKFALFKGGDKVCRKEYGKRSAFLHATTGECWTCPSGFSESFGRIKPAKGCTRINFRACEKGLKKLSAGGQTNCYPRPPKPKQKGLSPLAAAKLTARAQKDIAANSELIGAMAKDIRNVNDAADASGDRRRKLLCRTNPSQASRALATGLGLTTVTYETTGDLQFIYGRNFSGGYASYIGLDAETKGHVDANGNVKRYPTVSTGTSWGISAGADLSYQMGFWKGEPAGLAGESDSVTLAVAYVGGLSVSAVYVGCDSDCRFAGIVVAPQIGTSVEGEVSHGSTSIVLEDHCAL